MPLLFFVGNKSFHHELKLTDVQAKRLIDFRQKVWGRIYTTPPEDLMPEAHRKAFVAELKATLDADQLRRAGPLAVGLVLRDD
ncbi:MAG: hypothetical protein U0840_00965 [Gemmataceae bacterium]